jgi:hypothetical protein
MANLKAASCRISKEGGNMVKQTKIDLFLVTITVAVTIFLGATNAIGADKIKTMLLRPGGWLVEWKGNSSGVMDFVFEERGENIVVNINNAAWNMTCERDVEITSDVVKLDGCNDTGISLLFDPNDREYPFKGESQKVNYKLKAK